MFQCTDFFREGSVWTCTCRKIGRDPWKQRNIFPSGLESDIFWIDCGASGPFREKGKIIKIWKRGLSFAGQINFDFGAALRWGTSQWMRKIWYQRPNLTTMITEKCTWSSWTIELVSEKFFNWQPNYVNKSGVVICTQVAYRGYLANASHDIFS